MSEFKWTDELVKEFCHAAFFNARNSISDFKKKWELDHQPKDDQARYVATTSSKSTHDEIKIEKLKVCEWPTILREVANQYEKDVQPKPEWEIVSYLDTAMLTDGPPHVITKNDCSFSYTSIRYPIHSVKRLSDGEIFTVGDTVEVGIGNTNKHPKPFVVYNFKISHYNDMRVCPLTDAAGWSITNIVKSKANTEWEILEFKHRGSIAKLMDWESVTCYSTPQYKYPGQQFGIKWALDAANGCSIHSVKRLSDGEVFTVGDKFWIKHQAGEYWVIDKIEIGIEGDIRFISPSGYNWGLKLALKHPIHQSPMPVYLTPSQLEKLLTLLK